MRQGDVRPLRVGKETIPCSFLGKGEFAKAWRDLTNPDKVYLFVTGDMSKTALDRVIHRHIPYIEDMGYANPNGLSDDYTRLYMMRYYAPLTKDHKEAWAIRKELARAKDQAWQDVVMPHFRDQSFNFRSLGQAVNCRTEELADVPQSVKFALQTMIDRLADYGQEYVFDNFRVGNCGIDQDGNLILRDVAFSLEAAHEKHEATRIRRQNRQPHFAYR